MLSPLSSDPTVPFPSEYPDSVLYPDILSRSTRGSRQVAFRTLRPKGAGFENPRTVSGLSDEKILELVDSITRNKALLTPLTVQRLVEDDGVTEVIHAGQRRWKALCVLHNNSKIFDETLVWVNDRAEGDRDYDDKEAQVAMAETIEGDLHREALSSYELVRAGAELLGKLKQSEIAKRFGRSESWWSRMLGAWGKATDELKASFRDGKVTDEQWKGFATVKKASQPEAVKEIVEIRERGEQSAARQIAKNTAEENTPAPKSRGQRFTGKDVFASFDNPTGVVATGVKPVSPAPGSQADLKARFKPDPYPAIKQAVVAVPEILELAKILPPLDTYTKGAIEVLRYLATGKAPGKPWKIWMAKAQKAMQKRAKKLEARPTKTPTKKVAKGKAAKVTAKPKAPPKQKASPSSVSKACTARHHVRCQGQMRSGQVTSCACDCHGGK